MFPLRTTNRRSRSGRPQTRRRTIPPSSTVIAWYIGSVEPPIGFSRLATHDPVIGGALVAVERNHERDHGLAGEVKSNEASIVSHAGAYLGALLAVARTVAPISCSAQSLAADCRSGGTTLAGHR